MTAIEAINSLKDDAASRAFARCCGAKRWVAAMVAGRPYKDLAGLYARADSEWWKLGREDWLEAFSHHPRIGDVSTMKRAKGTRDWASSEQAGALEADPGVQEALAELNGEYEKKFGHVYLVCASGKSGSELLQILRARLGNAPDQELRVAAEEQQKITRLRLEKLLK